MYSSFFITTNELRCNTNRQTFNTTVINGIDLEAELCKIVAQTNFSLLSQTALYIFGSEQKKGAQPYLQNKFFSCCIT